MTVRPGATSSEAEPLNDLVDTAARLARLGGWEIDLTTSQVFWSDEVSAIHGVSPGVVRTAQEVARYRAPETAELVQASLDACSREGRPFDLESAIITEAGNRVPVRITGEAVRDSSGNVVIVRGAFQDLTNWKRTERSLEERQAELRLLHGAVDRLNDMVVITEAGPVDEPGPRIVYVNDSFIRKTGYSREEVIGRSPRFMQGKDTDPRELGRLRAAITAGEGVKVEVLNYRKDGGELRLEIDLSPIHDAHGRIVNFVAVERDIAERKSLEAAIAKTGERLRAIFRASALAIWDWDVVGKNVWRMEAGDQTSILQEEALSPDGPLGRRIHPDDLADVRASMLKFLGGDADTWVAQYRFQDEQGNYLSAANRAFAIRDAGGTIVRVFGVVSDITENQVLEEKLRRAQRLEAVGQLTGGIAHDFNNLLTVILGNTEMLFDSLAHDPDLGYLASITHSAAERGAQLTKRLIAFARQQPLEPRAFDANRTLAGMHGLLRRTVMENVELTIKLGQDLLPAFADPVEFENALLNLVINARDAMPTGGRLLIETRNEKLDENYASANEDVVPGDYVLVAVSDTGMGMAPEVVARVFEPFFTTKPFGQGSGLGLSMVYGYLKQSKGHVRIYSEVGHGTTVRLYFPAARGAVKSEGHFGHATRLVGGTERILIVEDDALVREFAYRQLRELGYHAVATETAAQALMVLREQDDFDLLFTDVVMPGGMNGRQLADEVAKLRPDLPVLFTSGYTENAIVHAGRLDPGVMLLNKPYSRMQLALKVREVIDSHGAFIT